MPLRLPLAAALVLLAAAPAAAQRTTSAARLGAEVERVLDARAFDDAYWGVHIRNLSTGEVLFDRNGPRRLIPASNMKLLSTAAALDALGPDWRYETVLYGGGPVEGGTLRGPLVVRGAGDPSLGGRYADGDLTRTFRQWADSLKARGIRRIDGPVVGDDDVFDDVHLGAGWQWDDLVWYYGAEISGLQFNEGTFRLTSRGTAPGQPTRVSLDPDVGYVRIVNQTVTTPEGSVREGYSRELSANVFTLTSRVPAGRTEEEDLSVVNPTAYFVRVMASVFEREGIRISGETVDVDEWGRRPDYARLTRLASHRSPRLAEIVEQTNTDSNNLYAEHLLRTLGAYVYDGTEEAPGSARAGWEVEKGFLQRIGVDPESFRVADGSGLSALSRLTPVGLVAVLSAMHAHEDRATAAAFRASLPVGGYTGTLARRYGSGDARGNVRAKTGFITGARTLSGYVTSAAGDTIAFSLMCNNYSVETSRVNRAQDEIVELLADYAGR